MTAPLDFAALLAPIPVDRFMAEHFDQRPLHVPAPAEGKPRPLDWAGLNRLLATASHWTNGNVRLVLDSRPVLAEHYMDDVATMDGPMRRADPAKIELFMAMGASFVANYAEEIAPELLAVTESVSARLAALANANIYCSFAGVQGFATHYDLSDVFALQCEGEKRWRIHANRALNPVDPPPAGGADAQAALDAQAGPVATEVTLGPGDLLYLPRGVFHSAMTHHGASLHVTFSAAPHNGRAALELLTAAALEDALVRAYLPDGRSDPTALADRLATIGERLQGIAASPGFAARVVDAQRRRVARRHRLTLPARPTLCSYARTDRAAEVRRAAAGAVLASVRGTLPVDDCAEAADWAIARPAFSDVELAARFAHVPAAARAALIDALLRLGLVERYTPQR